MSERPRIAVFGAGSIGCHLGGALGAVAEVTLIGRPAAMAAIEEHGLTLTGGGGGPQVRRALRLATGPAGVAGAAYVLVTVKSADTAQAARELAPHLASGAVVISFQNGLHNAAVLRAGLPGHRVLAGMVPYNVVRTGPAAVHQGSGGQVLVEAAPAADGFVALGRAAGLELAAHPDMRGIQAAKLLLNLNNAVNALSDLPLREQLGQRAYRRCLALCQREGLAAFRRAGVVPARLGPVPPARLPAVLGLPDGVFRRLAGATLRIDAQARSSMWEDLQRGRPTEIDSLQGEVVALAAAHGLTAPANARLVELVRAAERGAREPWSGPALLAELKAASQVVPPAG
ncbi:2-dehydropantoate 2-reductase [Kitasatospora sp. MMS16-BH015]|uniref:2-dehydropantoate 2-reductase n=1 Tax=Kitasatospora sp. MMS16-BH015 TaxID=2018025 RepID=UPI000CA0DDE3|nr:2-dehydropantoate 2-reductase [Kitasatospora sp. MMS16-BH015]AUG80597.1 2-dehydropantoate 2-reductase [Kitasatospora sp. MMS16-BH015]